MSASEVTKPFTKYMHEGIYVLHTFAQHLTVEEIMSEITEEVSRLIKEARTKAGLTQKELGERLGISESAVNKLENRKNVPSIPTLERVANATGLKLKVTIE